MIDVFFILAAPRPEAIAVAMAELSKSRLTHWLVEVLGQIPVVRGDSESGKQAMESASRALEDGALVGIFPEQKCVKPGENAPYRPGVAVLSTRMSVPIVPVRLVPVCVHARGRGEPSGHVVVSGGMRGRPGDAGRCFLTARDHHQADRDHHDLPHLQSLAHWFPLPRPGAKRLFPCHQSSSAAVAGPILPLTDSSSAFAS